MPRRFLAAAFLLLLGATPAPAQDIAPGMTYDAARAALVAAGWQPLARPDADRCTPGDARCEGRPEMVACSGTGLGPCVFAWRRGAAGIEVIAAGVPFVVTGMRRP